MLRAAYGEDEMKYEATLGVLEDDASGRGQRVLWRVQQAIRPSSRAVVAGCPVLATGSLLELGGFKSISISNGRKIMFWIFTVHSAQGFHKGFRLRVPNTVVKHHIKPVEVEG